MLFNMFLISADDQIITSYIIADASSQTVITSFSTMRYRHPISFPTNLFTSLNHILLRTGLTNMTPINDSQTRSFNDHVFMQ